MKLSPLFKTMDYKTQQDRNGPRNTRTFSILECQSDWQRKNFEQGQAQTDHNQNLSFIF